MPPQPEYKIPPAEPAEQPMSGEAKFGSGIVSAKKIFILGMVLPLFAPPLVGIIYALTFIFNKNTRREATIVLVWAIAWGILIWFVGQWMALQGYSLTSPGR